MCFSPTSADVSPIDLELHKSQLLTRDHGSIKIASKDFSMPGPGSSASETVMMQTEDQVTEAQEEHGMSN